MENTIEPKPVEPTEPIVERDVPVATLENPKEKQDDFVPIINRMKLQQFFNIQRPSVGETDTLNKLYEFFEKSGAESMDEVFIRINEIEQKLGATPMGQTRINQLWNYVKVLSQIQHYEKLKGSFEHA